MFTSTKLFTLNSIVIFGSSVNNAISSLLIHSASRVFTNSVVTGWLCCKQRWRFDCWNPWEYIIVTENLSLVEALCLSHIQPRAPCDFYHPYDFFARKAEWSARRHYNDVIMGAIASQITSLTIVYSIVYSDADQRKHQSSASLAFVRGIHRGPVNSPHKWPVTRKMFPFDDLIMGFLSRCCSRGHIRLRAPYAWHGCTLMVWSNDSQDSTGAPYDARTGIVRAPQGNLQCFSYPTGAVRDPQGCRTTPLRTRKGIDTTKIDHNPTRALYLAIRSPHGLFTGCSRSQNPYGAR